MAVYDATQIGLGDIADLVFGSERKDRLLEAGIDTPRAVWELSNATTQCHGVLPTIRDPTGTPCYICGIPIDNTKTRDENGGKMRPAYPGLEGECEHLLAIAQAIIFLGLYWAGMEKSPDKFLIYEPLKNLVLEYLWAHHTCNQIKSDRSFIQFNMGKQRWEPKVAAILKLLEDIYTNTRDDSDAYNRVLRKKYKTLTSFIKARLRPIVSNFEDICSHINVLPPGLTILYGAAKVLEGPMNPRARELLDSNTDTASYNTNALKRLTNAAWGLDALDRIKGETIQLLPSALKTKEMVEFIEGQGSEHIEPYVKLLLSEPNTAEPYLKILFLRRLSEYLKESGNRQHVTISRLANLLTMTSKLSESTIAGLTSELEGYMSSVLSNGNVAVVENDTVMNVSRENAVSALVRLTSPGFINAPSKRASRSRRTVTTVAQHKKRSRARGGGYRKTRRRN